MEGVSICITLKNRADLLKWALESINRQDYPHENIEICIADGGSNDGLFNLIDRYSDEFTFKYAFSDRNKAYVPVNTNCPAADLNVMIKYIPTYDTIIKMDPEVVMKDTFLISEMVEAVTNNYQYMYNSRCHFTERDDWYFDYDDIINNYWKHYHFAEGGPFSRAIFYFCSGFSRTSFIEMDGIEETFGQGAGFEDACFRDHWKNHFGSYEKEILAESIHLWHLPQNQSPSLYELNRRRMEVLKNKKANSICVTENPEGEAEFVECDREWGNPAMLSKIYTIKESDIINVEAVTDDAVSLDIPL
jgi:glycosyltransferase involved in cell wall biosynthesis